MLRALESLEWREAEAQWHAAERENEEQLQVGARDASGGAGEAAAGGRAGHCHAWQHMAGGACTAKGVQEAGSLRRLQTLPLHAAQAMLRRHAQERQLLEEHLLRLQPSATEAVDLASAYAPPPAQPSPPRHSRRQLRPLQQGPSPYLQPLPPGVRAAGRAARAAGSSDGASSSDWGDVYELEGAVERRHMRSPRNLPSFNGPQRASRRPHWQPWGTAGWQQDAGSDGQRLRARFSHNGWDGGGTSTGAAIPPSSPGWHPKCSRPTMATSRWSAPAPATAAGTCTPRPTSPCWQPRASEGGEGVCMAGPAEAGQEPALEDWDAAGGEVAGVAEPAAVAAFDSADWDVFATLQHVAQQWSEAPPPPRCHLQPRQQQKHRARGEPGSGGPPSPLQPAPPPQPPPGLVGVVQLPASPLARRLAQLKGHPEPPQQQGALVGTSVRRLRSSPAGVATGEGPPSCSACMQLPLVERPKPTQERQAPGFGSRQGSQESGGSGGASTACGSVQEQQRWAPGMAPTADPGERTPHPPLMGWDRQQDLLPQLLNLLLTQQGLAMPLPPQAQPPAAAPHAAAPPLQQEQGTGAAAAGEPALEHAAEPLCEGPAVGELCGERPPAAMLSAPAGVGSAVGQGEVQLAGGLQQPPAASPAVDEPAAAAVASPCQLQRRGNGADSTSLEHHCSTPVPPAVQPPPPVAGAAVGGSEVSVAGGGTTAAAAAAAGGSGAEQGQGMKAGSGASTAAAEAAAALHDHCRHGRWVLCCLDPLQGAGRAYTH